MEKSRDAQVIELEGKLEGLMHEEPLKDATPGQIAGLKARKTAAGVMIGALQILHPKKGDTDRMTNQELKP